MNEAELLFNALAELSTRQIAEVEQATGVLENAKAGKKGGSIVKNARKELEAQKERLIKPIKIRGHISQGLIVPIKDLQQARQKHYYTCRLIF